MQRFKEFPSNTGMYEEMHTTNFFDEQSSKWKF